MDKSTECVAADKRGGFWLRKTTVRQWKNDRSLPEVSPHVFLRSTVGCVPHMLLAAS